MGSKKWGVKMKSQGRSKAIRAALLISAAALLSSCTFGSGYQTYSGSLPFGQYQSSSIGSAQFANGFGSPSTGQDHVQGPLDAMSDQELSDRVTDYLHRNLLPLVQANVQRDANGQRKIVLSGFVASTYGKNDAVAKVNSYLNNPSWPVTNYIRVSPNLAQLNAQYRQSHPLQDNNSSSSTGNPDNGANGSSSWSTSNALNAQQLPPGAEAYIQQQQAAQAMPIAPMMPMGGMMFGGPGFGFGTGGFGFGSGFGFPFGGFGMMPGFGFFP
jgi:hypothetical protein